MFSVAEMVFRAIVVTVIAAGSANADTLAANSGDGVYHVTVQDTLLDFRNPETGATLDRWQLDRPATAIALNEWGGMIYLGHADGTIRAFESATVRQRWNLRWFNTPVVRISVWDDELMIVDRDGSTVILDAMTGQERPDSPRDLQTPAPTAPIAARLFSEVARIGFADGRVLEYDRLARIWTAIPVQGIPTAEAVRREVNRVPDIRRTVTQTIASANPVTQPTCNVGEQCPATSVVPMQNRSIRRMVTAPDMTEALDQGRFPWPPPPYSDVYPIDGYRLAASGMRTYEDVSRRVTSALSLGAYKAPRYYTIDDGFVMVTQVEEIDANGAPVNPADQRWWNGTAPRPDPFTFSLKAFFDALSSAPVGRYRIIAFALNVGECVTPPCARPAEIDAASAQALAGGGEPSLPYTIRNALIDPARHTLSVLVYAFEKPNKTLSATLTRRHSAATHLTATNVMAGLP